MTSWPWRRYADYCVYALCLILFSFGFAAASWELTVGGFFLALGYVTGKLTR